MTDLFDWSPTKYPATPGFKEGTTSKAAAKRIEPRAQVLRDQAYAALRNEWPGGLTADEVAVRIGKNILSVRPRLSELRADKKILPALEEGGKKPQRRKNESGSPATVWVVARPEGA